VTLKLLKKIEDDCHEFKPILAEIEDSPVSPLGRSTFWILMAVILFTLLWLCLGQIDVVVSARGKVVPTGEVKTLQPLETGVIRNILVSEGQFVKKGQPLVEIEPALTQPALASSETDFEHVTLETERLSATLDGKPFIPPPPPKPVDFKLITTQRSLYRASTGNLEKRLASQREALKRLDAQVKALAEQQAQNKALLASAQAHEARLRPVMDIIPKNDYQRVVDEITGYQSKIVELDHEKEALSHQQAQVKAEMKGIEESFRTETLQELVDKQKQMTQLKAKLDETTLIHQRQTLVAPVDGYVDEVLIHTVGGVVTPAEKLLTLVPAQVPLLIQAEVLNQDIGFVRTGMPVAIKIDAYDFQKYGMLQGKVRHISNDSHDDEKNPAKGPVYEVEIQPQALALKQQSGKALKATSGMSLTAEIKVGERRIIEFFIYPIIKAWHDGISVR
jgi:hemolysin D